MAAEENETPQEQLQVELRVGRVIHTVTLEPSETQRVKLTAGDPDQIDGAGWKEISRQIIKLCELGCMAKKLGLTKDDMIHADKRFIIRRT